MSDTSAAARITAFLCVAAVAASSSARRRLRSSAARRPFVPSEPL